MKQFTSITELLTIATGKQIYLVLKNGYAVRVSKKDIKQTAKSIVKHGVFSGTVIADNDLHTHIEIN